MDRLIGVRLGPLKIDLQMDIDPDYDSDRVIAHWNDDAGCCEPDLVLALWRILQPGDTVIDGGANVGYFSLIMAHMVGEQGRVLAFEPEPRNVVKLERNLQLNGFRHVQVIQKALGASGNKKVVLYLDTEDTGGHSIAPLYNKSDEIVVPMTTIDAWFVRPRFIKLDIEGAEIEALKGARRTIRDYQPYIVCEMNSGALERFGENIYNLRDYALHEFGYDTYVLLRTHSYPLLAPPGVEIRTPIANTNIMFATQAMIATAFPVLNYTLPFNILQRLQNV